MNLKRRGVVALVAVALVGLSLSLVADSKFVKSEPADGSTVTSLKSIQVWFDTEPNAKDSKLEMKGPSGAVKLMGLHAMEKSLMAMVEGETPGGAYTVLWHTVAHDGDLMIGSFKFTLKPAN